MVKKTKTATFGSSKRESHDASSFYARNLYAPFDTQSGLAACINPTEINAPSVPARPLTEWADQIYCHTSEDMCHIPDASVALAFTSPPYNAGKTYDEDLALKDYLDLISKVGAQVYRVLKPGGRYVINIANLGRTPYIPLHAFFYVRHLALGFQPAGEIIWQKGKGMSSSCAWGSWQSASAPRLRDIHEYLLVFTKEGFRRPDKGQSDISSEEFMAATLSIWDIRPESARKIGHPAPFPVELAARVLRLFSYVDDVVLDPFNGSGSTCVAAMLNNRHYVGYDIDPSYCELAKKRLAQAKQATTNPLFPDLP